MDIVNTTAKTQELENVTSTIFPEYDVSESSSVYDDVRDIVYYVIVPMVCAFGIVGNSFNLIIFTRRRMRHRLSTFEKASITGLTSLSVSDLMFCVIVITSYALEKLSYATKSSALTKISFYFWICRISLINTFLFSSTWIITWLSLERLAAVKYPFAARQLINNRRTIIVNVLIYVISIVFNVPSYLQYEIISVDCGPDCSHYTAVMGWLNRHEELASAYSLSWIIVGTFVPMLILFVCNLMFIVLIYNRTKAMSKHTTIDRRLSLSVASSHPGACVSGGGAGGTGTGSRKQPRTMLCTTLILVVIIVMFFLLVCPSMVLNLLKERSHGWTNSTYRIYMFATVFCNLTQAVNFSVNFILYFAMSRDFRRTFRRLLCGHRPCRRKLARRGSNSIYTPVSPNSDTNRVQRFSFKTDVERSAKESSGQQLLQE